MTAYADRWVRENYGLDWLLYKDCCEESKRAEAEFEAAELRMFNEAYDKAADDGKADSRGGAEYGRVLSEWEYIGGSVEPYPFIWWRANIDATSPDLDLDGPAAQARLEAMRRAE